MVTLSSAAEGRIVSSFMPTRNPAQEARPASEETPRSLELQLDWDYSKLHGQWPTGRDNEYIMERLKDVPVDATVAGASGPILEVAAAEAILSCKINRHGLETFVLEPSPVMLEQARKRATEYGAALTLVRGVAETLPFRGATFDRVLCDSAIDHVADPQRSIAEMTRVLRSDGRLIIGVVNYGSLSVRLSRRIYRLLRATGQASYDQHLFWDTPVPIEHTFECTYPILLRLCEPYLDLERAYGVSLGWMTPGWGLLLGKLSRERAARLLARLDRLAHDHPRHADYVLSVWRPKRAVRYVDDGRPVRLNGADEQGAPRTPYVVGPGDVVYPWKAKAEAEYWAKRDFGSGFYSFLPAGDRDANLAYTGDPERSWLDDLIGRGPFGTAAMLGCDEPRYEAAWLDAGASESLDVYELSAGVIRKVRAELGMRPWSSKRQGRPVRFIRADLNFVRLPAAHYDVIWSSGCLHHVTNLESLFSEIERALKPGGIFALHDFVGERRLQYTNRRLERINEVLQLVPRELRRGGTIALTRPRLEELSPFCAVRSDELLDKAGERFEVVHLARAGALFPLTIILDLPAIEREAPHIKDMVGHAEAEAMREPSLAKCGAYAVFRKPRR
jgi:ubiquinone/menaquinone biosynthesis C-methylase UbiE